MPRANVARTMPLSGGMRHRIRSTAFVSACVLALGATLSAAQTPTVPDAARTELLAAEVRYRQAISVNPQIAAYHTSLGVVLQRLGRADDALAAYGEAVRLEPTSARAQGTLGEFLLQRGHHVEAVEPLEQAVRYDPWNLSYRMALARAHIAAERWGAAARELEYAAAMSPSDSQAQTLLTEARLRTGVSPDAPVQVPAPVEPPMRSLMARVPQVIFGFILIVSGIILAAPILGTLYLLLIALPLHLLRPEQPHAT